MTDAGAIDEINTVLYSMSTSLVDVSELFNAQVFTTKASSFNLTLARRLIFVEGTTWAIC